MNKFTKIINKALEQLNEVNADGTTASGPYNGGVSTTAVNASAKQKPEGVANANNPLHTAFNKIQEDPDNPNLSDEEHAAVQGLAKSLEAAKSNSTEKTEEEKQAEAGQTSSSSTSYTANPDGGQVQSTITQGTP